MVMPVTMADFGSARFLEVNSSIWIAVPLLVAVHVLTIASDALEYAVASLFTGRPGMWRLAPFLIGYTFYIAYYQRLNRLIAYLSELIFRHSYHDPFYPTKVREAQEQF